MSRESQGVVTQVGGKDLIVQELGDELVVFNRRTNTAHLLNPQAARAYRAAGDGCSLSEVARRIGPGGPEERTAVARLAIAELASAGIVESTVVTGTRRSLLRTLGASVALPMVVSILAPTPAAALSGLLLGDTCTDGVDTCILQAICLGGHCCVPLGGFCHNPNPFCCGDAICGGAGKCCLEPGKRCTLNSDCCSGTCNASTCA